MPYVWKKRPGEIARRLDQKAIPGILRDEVVVHEFERMFLLRDGAVVQVLDHGRHDIGGGFLGRLRRTFGEAIFVDFTDKDLKYGFGDMRLKDGIKVGCHGEIRFRIHEPQLFFANLLGGSEVLTLDDLWERAQLEIKNLMSPILARYTAEDMYSNPAVRSECYNSIDMDMRKTFMRWGLELINLTIDYGFPEEWLEMEKRRMRMVTEAKLKAEAFCPKCGRPIPPGARFCPECGTKLVG